MSEPIAPGPLAGLRVLELAHEAVQYAGKLLADMGAEVIKVEQPGGDSARRIGPFYQDQPDPNRSIPFWYYNTNKRSITLNLQMEDGREILRRLVPHADVLLESFRPSHLETLGLGYSNLKELNSRLIMTSITAFGQTGPYRHFKSSDLVSLAMGGPMHSTGYDDHDIPPVRGGGSQGYHTGCHYGVIGTLVALIHRDATGQGQYLDCSRHEAISCTTEGGMVSALYDRIELIRQTGRHASSVRTPPSQFLCQDGRYVGGMGVMLVETTTWKRLVALLEQDGLAMDLGEERLLDPELRRLEASHITEALEAYCLSHTAEEVFRQFQALGVNVGRVRAPHELVDDPHLRERGFMVEVEHPELGRTFRYPGAPYKFSESLWRIRRRAPLVGEDNLAIYQGELGLSRSQLVTLAEAGVI